MNNIQYDKYGRMLYDPDLHPNHNKPWKTTDQNYLIQNYEIDGPEQVSLALGRTTHVVMTRAYELRKKGLMPPRSKSAKRHKRCKRKNGA